MYRFIQALVLFFFFSTPITVNALTPPANENHQNDSEQEVDIAAVKISVFLNEFTRAFEELCADEILFIGHISIFKRERVTFLVIAISVDEKKYHRLVGIGHSTPLIIINDAARREAYIIYKILGGKK